MRQSLGSHVVDTRGRGIYEFTSAAIRFVQDSKIENGLLTLHVRHTSASLLIQENADPTVKLDLENFFARLAPDGDALYEHDMEGPDDMPAHIRSALTPVNLSIPLSGGRLALGTWQGIYLWEHRTHPHRRQISLHIIGE
jgi:secondary thiamine-phosphate synthase enzyme